MMPREGQRVRVILEGVAQEVYEVFEEVHFALGLGTGGANEIHPSAEHVVSVEILPDPEPTEWGAARITRDGRLWLRIATREDTPWVHYREEATNSAVDWSSWADMDDPQPAVRAEP